MKKLKSAHSIQSEVSLAFNLTQLLQFQSPWASELVLLQLEHPQWLLIRAMHQKGSQVCIRNQSQQVVSNAALVKIEHHKHRKKSSI